jgi:hypothetical protein
VDIKNVTQFSNFITSNGLMQLDGIFSQIVQCLATYSSACNCYKVQDKQLMYANCNKLYANAVAHIVPRFKNIILPKIADRQISFYMDNGTLISTISR